LGKKPKSLRTLQRGLFPSREVNLWICSKHGQKEYTGEARQMKAYECGKSSEISLWIHLREAQEKSAPECFHADFFQAIK
jgi:hypothetical protein